MMKTRIENAFIGFICILILFAIISMTINIENKSKEKNINIKENQDEIEYVDIVISTREIPKDKEIEQEDLKYQDVNIEYLPDNYIRDIKKIIGKKAIVDIDKNVMMSNNYIDASTILNNEEVEIEFFLSDIKLDEELEVGNLCNVDIVKKNETEHLMISNKEIIQKDMEKICLKISAIEKVQLEHVVKDVENYIISINQKGELEY